MAKLSADGMIKSKERTSMHDIKDALLIGLEGVGKTTVKAFVVTPHEMREILVINVFEMIFIAQFIN